MSQRTEATETPAMATESDEGLGHLSIDPLPDSPSRSNAALIGLFVLALAACVYLARAFLIPVVLAFYLKLVLTPVVRKLRVWGIPSPVGAAFVVGTGIFLVAAAAYELSAPANDWIERAPSDLRRLERRFRDLKAPVEKVSQAAEQVEEMADVDGQPDNPQVEVRGSNLVSYVFRGSRSFAATAVSSIVLLYLLLASGDLFLRKTITVVPRLEDKVRAVDLSRELESHISRYLFTIALVNTVLGSAVALALWLLGMPNPPLWGVMVALFNFVPYVGALASFTVLSVAAFITFDDVGRALMVGGVFFALNALEAYVVTPTILGRRMSMNPVAIFVSVMFFGWAWGVLGALLAVPMLVTFKLCCDHVEPLAAVAEYLGG